MTFEFNVLTQEQAENIAFNWRYDGEYSFYDMDADEEDLAEFLNAQKRGNSTYAVSERNDLIGYLSVTRISDKIFNIGLGMRPDFTGKGKGIGFLKEIIDFIQSEFRAQKITLSVATFNQRAIKAYRKVGFVETKTFKQDTNGSTFKFLQMVYECNQSYIKKS